MKNMNITEIPFIHSYCFRKEEAAITAYDTIQQILRDENEINVSAYRLFQNWQEAEPNNKPWFVIVLGDTPPEPIARKMLTALKTGEIAPLPDEIIAELARRTLNRREEMEATNKYYLERQ